MAWVTLLCSRSLYLPQIEPDTSSLEFPPLIAPEKVQPWAFTLFLTARDECDFISWKLLLGQSSLFFSVWLEVACKSLVSVMLLLCVDVSVCNLGNASRLPHILHSLVPVHILNDLQRWLLPSRLFLSMSFLVSLQLLVPWLFASVRDLPSLHKDLHCF